MKLKTRPKVETGSRRGSAIPNAGARDTAPENFGIVITEAEIAVRAYAYWEARGSGDGSAEDDWYHAVEDLLRERGNAAPGPGEARGGTDKWRTAAAQQ